MPFESLMMMINLFSTGFMTGLIWFVQVVHYPLFSQVNAEGFCDYHHQHTRRTTWIVGPVMLLEAMSAGVLLVWRPAALPAWAAWTGAAMVAGLWISTALVQVPCHNRLAERFDPAVARRLNRTNWVRTLLWSARLVLMGWGVMSGAAGR